MSSHVKTATHTPYNKEHITYHSKSFLIKLHSVTLGQLSLAIRPWAGATGTSSRHSHCYKWKTCPAMQSL